MSIVDISNDYLYYQRGREKIRIEPWGKDSLRIRVTYSESFLDENWALMPEARRRWGC